MREQCIGENVPHYEPIAEHSNVVWVSSESLRRTYTVVTEAEWTEEINEGWAD